MRDCCALSPDFWIADHRKMAVRDMILLATLDRIAIGSILRSKLVFLINVPRLR